jgi:cytosine/adenosine deaminase-related metal-dependent hydrolase
VDLGDAVLFPGLINAHCHLDYTDMRDQVPWRGDFRDWILRITKLKKLWTEEQYVASINRGLAELARTGTTSVVNIECFPKLVARLAPTPSRIWWCPELLDLTWSEESRRMVDDAVRWLETQPHGGLAPHAPYTTTEPLYRLASRVARERGWVLTTHIAEDQREVPLVELGVLGPNCLLAHANHLDEAEVESVASTGASVVHCPRAHRFFRRESAPWELWRRYGVNVCLGTDSLASNESLDIRAEMRALHQFPSQEVLAMATVNAAKALNCEGKLGKITVGGLADLAAVPLDGDPYESVVRSEKPVCFAMVGGKVVLQ